MVAAVKDIHVDPTTRKLYDGLLKATDLEPEITAAFPGREDTLLFFFDPPVGMRQRNEGSAASDTLNIVLSVLAVAYMAAAIYRIGRSFR